MKRVPLPLAIIAMFVGLALGACGGSSDTPSHVNSAPTANAGADQSVTTGALVTLHGTGSSDADGDSLTYRWSFTSRPGGSGATLSSATASEPTFTPDLAGSYALTLVVNDGKLDSAPDSVTLSATAPGPNAAPVADAGLDQSVATSSTVTLHGTGSSDADGDSLTYLWTFSEKPGGSGATLSSATAPEPTFTPDLAGSYVVSLVVNDGHVDSAPDSVTVTATTESVHAAPVADAGPDQSVTPGSNVQLDGTGSSASSGGSLSFLWAFTSKPGGSTAALSSATDPSPTFAADLAGTYVVSLVVNDGAADSPADHVTVVAAFVPPNTPPVAEAGPDRSVIAGAVVTLNGTSSGDVDGDFLTFLWSFEEKPPGSGATLSSTSSAVPSFTTDLAGAYVVRLVVNDGKVDSLADSVTVRAVDLIHVPDTGQTQSYTATTGEDADYTTNAPSYTDHSDGTVTDDVTNLVWQRQDDGTTRTWDAAVAYCSSVVTLPGASWRLPTPWELITIQHHGRFDPAIDTTVFPGAHAAFYWSGQEAARTATEAWAGDFSEGGALPVSKAASAFVRCVRGAPLGPSLVDNIDGTITDAATGLVWQRGADPFKKTWEQAIAHCEGLSLDGQTDWRVPNVKELTSLEDFARFPVADLTFFPDTKEDNYWSSTTVRSDPTTAWQASFYGGGVGLPGLVKTSTAAYVRCVRGQ